MTVDPMNDEKIEVTSLAEECYRRILVDILDDKIQWGERLDVIQLAKKYGVSRSPVVKAIQRLNLEGLVEIQPNRGSYVQVPTEKDVIEISQVRIAFESMACELAFEKNNELLIKELLNNEQPILKLERSGEAIPHELFLEYDRTFHRTFARLADNSRLLEIFEIIRNQVELFRVKSYSIENAKRAVKTHRLVIDELKKGQLSAAILILRQHIEDVCEDTIKTLQQNSYSRTLEPVKD